jgi:hypothetical protein
MHLHPHLSRRGGDNDQSSPPELALSAVEVYYLPLSEPWSGKTTGPWPAFVRTRGFISADWLYLWLTVWLIATDESDTGRKRLERCEKGCMGRVLALTPPVLECSSIKLVSTLDR